MKPVRDPRDDQVPLAGPLLAALLYVANLFWGRTG